MTPRGRHQTKTRMCGVVTCARSCLGNDRLTIHTPDDLAIEVILRTCMATVTLLAVVHLALLFVNYEEQARQHCWNFCLQASVYTPLCAKRRPPSLEAADLVCTCARVANSHGSTAGRRSQLSVSTSPHLLKTIASRPAQPNSISAKRTREVARCTYKTGRII